jgi:hypothetical protein
MEVRDATSVKFRENIKTGRMRFAPTVATEINKMFLPRWGEFCCVRVIAEGGAHS